ncbi:MAG: hypothetical protein HYS21_03500 [Deltaproteobacteria bacterium]|nr:hypothetical protein [Deltaproteobacteria bacterium]
MPNKKIDMKPDDFKLEFHFNEEGLFIIGNKEGLSNLANELQKAAQSGIGYHEHLNFSWKEKLTDGSFIIDFNWIKNRKNLEKENEFDVTVIKLNKIGKDLWEKKEE